MLHMTGGCERISVREGTCCLFLYFSRRSGAAAAVERDGVRRNGGPAIFLMACFDFAREADGEILSVARLDPDRNGLQLKTLIFLQGV